MSEGFPYVATGNFGPRKGVASPSPHLGRSDWIGLDHSPCCCHSRGEGGKKEGGVVKWQQCSSNLCLAALAKGSATAQGTIYVTYYSEIRRERARDD